MKTVKVTVKREQLKKALKCDEVLRVKNTTAGPDLGRIGKSITLELPVDQVEMPRPAKGFPSICPGEHEFEEIELGGMGKIKRCRLCGTAREVKPWQGLVGCISGGNELKGLADAAQKQWRPEAKRKRYRIVSIPESAKRVWEEVWKEYKNTEACCEIELEEVE